MKAHQGQRAELLEWLLVATNIQSWKNRTTDGMTADQMTDKHASACREAGKVLGDDAIQ